MDWGSANAAARALKPPARTSFHICFTRPFKPPFPQVAFMTYVFGGSGAYEGRDLGASHRRLIREQGMNHVRWGWWLGVAGCWRVGGRMGSVLSRLWMGVAVF